MLGNFKLGKGLVWLNLLVFALMWAPGVARAQGQQCAPYDALRAHLQDKYAEAMIWQGIGGPETVAQLWVNAETGTWTVVMYRADGVGCMVASGQESQAITPPPCGHGGLMT
jgi:hypothetical protein